MAKMTIGYLIERLQQYPKDLELKIDLKCKDSGGLLVEPLRVEKNKWEDFISIVVESEILFRLL